MFSFTSDVTTPSSVAVNETEDMQVIFDRLADAYNKERSKIEELIATCSYRGTTSKRLFSLFQLNKTTPSMHVYKRNLSPLRENYLQWNPQSPYEDNFIVFSKSEGGLFATMARLKTQYL